MGTRFCAKIPLTLLEGGVGSGRLSLMFLISLHNFSRLATVIIRILQPFLCLFFYWDLFLYFFNLLNFYSVTRFLVTPLLVTALLCLVTAGTAAPAIAEFHHTHTKKIKTFFRMRHLNMDVLTEFLNFKRDI